jgi:uncharacterized protein YndB with AHSA1/START domain
VQRIRVEYSYAVRAETLWDAYTDHAGWSAWALTPGARLIREGRIDRNGSGAVRGFIGGLREEILDFEPPRHMSYRVIAGHFPITNHFGEVFLESEGMETRLIWCCQFDPTIPGTGLLLQKFVGWTFRRSLIGLERHLSAAQG